MGYNYFISFAQNAEGSFGFSSRIINFKRKPSIEEIQKALEKHNKQFKEISIINFKLLTKKEVAFRKNGEVENDK